MLNILRTGKSQGIRFSKDQLLQDKGNVLFKQRYFGYYSSKKRIDEFKLASSKKIVNFLNKPRG